MKKCCVWQKELYTLCFLLLLLLVCLMLFFLNVFCECIYISFFIVVAFVSLFIVEDMKKTINISNKNTKVHREAFPHTFDRQVASWVVGGKSCIISQSLSFHYNIANMCLTSLKLNSEFVPISTFISAGVTYLTLYWNLMNLIISPTITADVQILNGSQATNTDFIRGENTPETLVEALLLHISKNIPLINMSVYNNKQSHWSNYWGSTGLTLK